jgi:uncharacterized membrane protein YhhN
MHFIKKQGILIFWIVLFIHCAFIYLGRSDYRHFSKLLLMPILIVYLFMNVSRNAYPTSKKIIYTGLFAAFIGDLLLIFNGTSFFIGGMLAFIITHIAYTAFFLKCCNIRFSKATEFVIAAVLVTVVAVKLLDFLKPYLGDMIWPVKIYMAAIAIMTASAANLLSNSLLKVSATTYFIPGAVLFVLSDSVLAANHFLYKDHFLDIVVMFSYGYAQCLMVQGFTRYLKA